MLTIERLKELLRYEPETGFWFWLVNRTNGVKAGDRAGHSHGGRNHLTILGKHYHCGSLAWFYMTGEWAPEHVDHENTDGSDDRWCNLRCATHAQNQANRRVFRNNLLGIKGVKAFRGRFIARIYRDGSTRFLGMFDTAQEAHEAYAAAAIKASGEFARAA